MKVIRGTIMRYPAHYKDQLLSIVGKACEVMENDDFEEAVEWVDAEFYDSKYFVDGIAKEHVLPYVEIPEELPIDDPYELMLDSFVKDIVKDMLSELKEKERDVLELRYGLNDGRERTLEEVGVIYNVTRERIRQIEAKALRKLQVKHRIEQLKDFW